MSQQQNDEKKMEKIRKMLDDPNITISHDDNEYLATLQKRLSHNSSLQPLRNQDIADTKDLTPSVVIHHKEQSTPLIPKPNEPPFVIKEKSNEQRSLFDDEELFEIEKIADNSLPEFVEVTPPNEKDEQEPGKTTDSNIVHLDETPEELPQWQLIDYELTSLIEKQEQGPQKTTDSNSLHLGETLEELPQWQLIDEGETRTSVSPKANQVKKKKPKKILKFSKSFKGSTIQQKDKEPQIWEEVGTIESPPKKMDFSPWIIKDTKVKKKEKPIKTKTPETKDSNQSSYSYGEYTLYRKYIQIGKKEKRTVHFFSKDVPEESEPASLPEGYSVHVNEKTGVPYIKKNR